MPRRGCSIDGCADPYRARGMCNRHYRQWRKAGGQPNKRPPAWTDREDLVLLAAGLTPQHQRTVKGGGRLVAVAAELGRTEVACRSRLQRLMKRAGHDGGQWTPEGLWTPEEDQVIREAMRREKPGWAQVAEDLGRRTPRACSQRARNLRLRDRLAGLG